MGLHMSLQERLELGRTAFSDYTASRCASTRTPATLL